MLTAGNKPVSIWGLERTFASLAPFKAVIQRLAGAPDTYIFASEGALLTALQNQQQNVNFQVKSGNQTASKTDSIGNILAQLDQVERDRAKDLRKGDKEKYLKLQQDAVSQGTAVFNTAKSNSANVFAGQKVCYYFQAAYMSGDQFAVGAALVHDGTSRLILLYQADEEGKAKGLVKFYVVSCKLTAARLLPVLVADSKAAYKACSDVLDKRLNDGPLPTVGAELAFLAKIPKGPFLFPVGGATTNVASCVLQGTSQGAIAKEWANVDPSKNKYWAYRVDKFLQRKGVQKAGRYVILWTRFSGKDGGAHPELDDSWTALGQIVHGLLAANYNVIVVGRPRTNKDITAKLTTHLTNLDATTVVARDNLKIWGEYWKLDGDAPNTKIIGPSRAAEYAIFLRMTQPDWKCRIVHLGMRSGAMDAAALLGMRTLFIEETGNEQIDRTKKWTGASNNNPLYKRVEVSELPTWTGKTGNKKATARGPARRGYGPADLKLILDEVKAALT
jgi:hypothetical protein